MFFGGKEDVFLGERSMFWGGNKYVLGGKGGHFLGVKKEVLGGKEDVLAIGCPMFRMSETI